MTQLLQKDGFKLAAQGLYDDMQKYIDSRMEETKSAPTSKGIREALEDMMIKKLEQSLETACGSDLHYRIIIEKKRILSDLGILDKVYDEIEKIDSRNGTDFLPRLEYLGD